MSKKKSKLPPSKIIITVGEMITQTKFSGKVNNVNMLNACIALMKDTQKFTGMQYKEIFAIVDGGLDAGVFRKKPTMNATVSNDADTGEEHN